MKILLGAFALVLPALATAQMPTADQIGLQIRADMDRRADQVREDMQMRQQEYWAQDRHQEQMEQLRRIEASNNERRMETYRTSEW